MKCNHCGTDNEGGSKFCLKCGKPLEITSNLVICPQCQHENKTGSIHCTECGNSLIDKPEVLGEKKKKTLKKTNLSPLVWVLIAVIGVVVLGILAYSLGLLKITGLPKSKLSLQGYESSVSEPSSLTTTGQTRIHWNCDGLKTKTTSSVSERTFIQVNIKWAAYTQEQVQDFLDQVQYAVTVDGNPVASRPYHDQILEKDGSFVVDNGAEIDPLDAGVHFVNLRVTINEKIYDGQDYYGPGSDVEFFEGICTIMVE